MNDIIKIIKSLEDLGVLIGGVDKKTRWISWNFPSTFGRFIIGTNNFFSSQR